MTHCDEGRAVIMGRLLSCHTTTKYLSYWWLFKINI